MGDFTVFKQNYVGFLTFYGFLKQNNDNILLKRGKFGHSDKLGSNCLNSDLTEPEFFELDPSLACSVTSVESILRDFPPV